MTDATLIVDGSEHHVDCAITWSEGGRRAAGRIVGDQSALSAAFEAGATPLRLQDGRMLKVALQSRGLDWTFRSVDG